MHFIKTRLYGCRGKYWYYFRYRNTLTEISKDYNLSVTQWTFFSIVCSSSWSSSGVRDATDDSNEVFEKSTLSRLKKTNIPADLKFLHYISFYICFRQNTEVYFQNKPFWNLWVSPLPPSKRHSLLL